MEAASLKGLAPVSDMRIPPRRGGVFLGGRQVIARQHSSEGVMRGPAAPPCRRAVQRPAGPEIGSGTSSPLLPRSIGWGRMANPRAGPIEGMGPAVQPRGGGGWKRDMESPHRGLRRPIP